MAIAALAALSASQTTAAAPSQDSLTKRQTGNQFCYSGDKTYYTGQIFSDVHGVLYNVSCDATSTAVEVATYNVNHDGFDHCFSVCDLNPSCIGFTYTGDDAGRCLLKADRGTDAFAETSVTAYMVGPKPVMVLVPANARSNACEECGQENSG
ncbi:hypothetical protein M8818_002509 [Zalaria obscura]|uniref:Uncharacterized protein n=1 Tax=Zalaria obscura TaxID=2024903 RepID=A0ACC3SGP2_9PEZI